MFNCETELNRLQPILWPLSRFVWVCLVVPQKNLSEIDGVLSFYRLYAISDALLAVSVIAVIIYCNTGLPLIPFCAFSSAGLNPVHGAPRQSFFWVSHSGSQERPLPNEQTHSYTGFPCLLERPRFFFLKFREPGKSRKGVWSWKVLEIKV